MSVTTSRVELYLAQTIATWITSHLGMSGSIGKERSMELLRATLATDKVLICWANKSFCSSSWRIRCKSDESRSKVLWTPANGHTWLLMDASIAMAIRHAVSARTAHLFVRRLIVNKQRCPRQDKVVYADVSLWFSYASWHEQWTRHNKKVTVVTVAPDIFVQRSSGPRNVHQFWNR
jgi:hypothetical protein